MATKSFRSAGAFLFSLSVASMGSVCVLRAASPQENIAEHFQQVDRNRDGVANGDEVRGTLWQRYDVDGDGSVTATEFSSGRAFDKRFAETAKDPQQAWVVLDWNQDGYLSGTELDGKWERYDADRDGKVQKHEFITARTGPAVFPGPAAPNVPPPAGTYVPPPADPSVPPRAGPYVPPPAGTYVPPPAPNEPVAPQADGGKLKSLWGTSLAEAQKSDLFQLFNLGRVGEAAPFEAGMQWSFQPKAGPYRELVTVKVIESDDKRIVAADLFLAGSFVNNPKTDVFARDIAQSFIAHFTPAVHAAATRDLVNELQFGAPNRLRVAGPLAPKLPDPPTAAYQTYLGKRESHEIELGDVKLMIRSAPTADDWLPISFQPARAAAM